MRKLYVLPLLLIIAAYGASAQKLRVHCLAETPPTTTSRFDTLQYQERFFRKRCHPETKTAKYFYYAAEMTARLANAEHCIFDRRTGRNYLPEMAQMK